MINIEPVRSEEPLCIVCAGRAPTLRSEAFFEGGRPTLLHRSSTFYSSKVTMIHGRGFCIYISGKIISVHTYPVKSGFSPTPLKSTSYKKCAYL